MGKEIIVNAQSEQTRIAITEKGSLAELYIENPQNERTIGDIYLARVRRVMPSIQAAFVDIGQKSDAFLHFSDLADNVPEIEQLLRLAKPEVGSVKIRPDNRSQFKRRRPSSGSHDGDDEFSSEEEDEAEAAEEQDGGGAEKGSRSSRSVKKRGDRRKAQVRSKRSGGGSGRGGSGRGGGHRGKSRSRNGEDLPRPESFLKKDQLLMVKIVKEPIAAKGSRVSTDISLAGRFLVLVPLADYVAVSKKIFSYAERRRLRALAKALLPPGFGVIVRTVAEGKNAKSLDTDLRLLIEKWRNIEARLAEKPQPPASLYEDVNMISSVIRDLFSEDYDRILVDDQRLHRNIRSYVQAVAPQMANSVQLHKGKKPIFEATNIDKEVNEAFSSRVDLPSGGYLYIEHTEAMHVVDVNSGRAGRGLSQEENSLRINIESARTIAKQLRLRDLGGIIVVDFIDLRDDKNRRKVYDELKREFRKDRAVTKVLPMSDFGLVQITRQRLRPSITTIMQANGAATNGNEPSPAAKAPGAANPPAESANSSDSNDTADKGSEKERVIPIEDLQGKMTRFLERYREAGLKAPVTLRVHPFTAAYLRKGVPNHLLRWFMKHRVRVVLEISANMSPFSFRFVDPKTGKRIALRRSRGGRRSGRSQRGNKQEGKKPEGNKQEAETPSQPSKA